MIQLFTSEEWESVGHKHLLPLKCTLCDKMFYQTKHDIKVALLPHTSVKYLYCSKECQSVSQVTKLQVNCTNCNNEFYKIPSQCKRSKNHFCSQSCAGTFNNRNKKYGIRRSKLEQYIESQLLSLYPNIEFCFNQKNAINSELDIYIPSLNLAFELNGLFHYEPVFGVSKLEKTQYNDSHKFKLCIENNIDLCIIDTSAQKKCTPQSSQKYLDIIITIINNRL